MRLTKNLLRSSAVAALVLALAPGRARGQDDDEPRSTRIHDVSDLAPMSWFPLRRNVADAGMFRVRTSRYSWDEIAGGLFEDSVDERFSCDDLASLVTSVISPIDQEAEVNADGGRRQLIVMATDAAQRTADDAVEVLRRAAGGPVRVHVEELVLPAGTPVPAAPDGAALARMREQDVRGAPRVLGLALDPGCWRVAEDLSAVRGIVDVDVEIAQDSFIADPIVDRMEWGLRVVARAQPLQSGGVVLNVLASTADLRGTPRRVSFGEEELGAVDLPDLDAGFVSTELALVPGAATTLVTGRPGAGVRVLVFRLVEAPAAVAGGTLRVLPYGGLSARPVSLRLAIGSEDEGLGDAVVRVTSDGAGAPRLDVDGVRQLLETTLLSDIEEGRAEIEDVDWMRGGSFAVRAESAQLDRVEERVRRLEQELVRHARLVVRFEERAPGASTGRVVGELSGSVPLGVGVAFGGYRNAAYVVDMDVEVAEKSRIADPLIGSAAEGVLANAVVSAARDGAYSVALELRALAFEEPQLLASGATDVGSMESITERTAYTETHVDVPAGGTGEVLLGSSPFSRSGARLVAVVSVE